MSVWTLPLFTSQTPTWSSPFPFAYIRLNQRREWRPHLTSAFPSVLTIFLPYISSLYNWIRVPYSVSPYFFFSFVTEKKGNLWRTLREYSTSSLDGQILHSFPFPIPSSYWTNFSLVTSKLGRSSSFVFGREEQVDTKASSSTAILSPAAISPGTIRGLLLSTASGISTDTR